jgi:hypothetical protein
VAIDVDWVSWSDVAKCDQAATQCGLEVEAVLDGDVLEVAVLGGWRGQKGEAGEEAEVGAADRIDGANAGGIPENRLEDDP